MSLFFIYEKYYSKQIDNFLHKRCTYQLLMTKLANFLLKMRQ